MFLLHISSSFKKEINTCVPINIDVFFNKNNDGEYETCPVIAPNSLFFEGVVTGHHF